MGCGVGGQGDLSIRRVREGSMLYLASIKRSVLRIWRSRVKTTDQPQNSPKVESTKLEVSMRRDGSCAREPEHAMSAELRKYS